VVKFATNSSGAFWLSNLEEMQVVLSGGQMQVAP
jgi:hypothetical protein